VAEFTVLGSERTRVCTGTVLFRRRLPQRTPTNILRSDPTIPAGFGFSFSMVVFLTFSSSFASGYYSGFDKRILSLS